MLEKFGNTEQWWLHNSVSVINTLNLTLKMIKMTYFMSYIFYHNKKFYPPQKKYEHLMAIEMFFQIVLQKSFYQFLQQWAMYEGSISP